MHPSRRRKKRPSYGIRSVELTRGNHGFGFTISGQAPCILSCIVNGSPAELAGLRPGHYLIAVNGLNVTKVPHDDVVHIIGQTPGILRLQISENILYSDSSEEEFVSVNRHKPKYPNRIRHKHGGNMHRAEKVVQDLQSGALFNEKSLQNIQLLVDEDNVANVSATVNANKTLIELMLQQRMRDAINSTGSKYKTKTYKRAISSPQTTVNFTEQELNHILYPSAQNIHEPFPDAILNFRAVVGYLGTIEMPKELQVPGSRLQAIRSCIRRLRVEKKVHTLVLLSVYMHQVLLTNPSGLTLAEYPAEKIAFSGVYADDKKFFGLITGNGLYPDDFSEDSHKEPVAISSSCHVFMVDARIQPHYKHTKRARIFRIECTVDPETHHCQEFPDSAEPILHAISAIYRCRPSIAVPGPSHHVLMPEPAIIGAPGLVNVDGHLSPPQRSNTSSNSSNSDSGIGFRDESGSHNSDRMFIVDLLDNAMNAHRRQNEMDENRLSLRSLRAGTNLSTSDSSLHQIGRVSHEHNNRLSQRNTPIAGVLRSAQPSPLTIHNMNSSKSPDRLTVRAMPDPVGYLQASQQEAPRAKTPQKSPVDNLMNIRATCDNLCNNSSIVCNVLSTVKKLPTAPPNKNLPSYKLSPKVYGVLPDEDASDGSHERHNQLVWSSAASQCSEQFDSEVERGVKNLKDWIGSTYFKKPMLKHRVASRTRSEMGTVSDGELATSAGCSSAKPGSSSATSSMIGLDRISTDINASSQGMTSNTENLSSRCSSVTDNERAIDAGRVMGWAASFEKLLDDPAGMHTFAEFLKSEFSQENILFWVASERYKNLKDSNQIKIRAKEIYENHLGLGASEPVNVDSHARQMVQDNLVNPTTELFALAQKQIFDLMKFDCYSRFLKGQIYKEALMQEMSGHPLTYQGDYTLNSSITWEQLDQIERDKASKPCEEKRKKSIIPWHRSKSKNGETKSLKDLDVRRSWRRKKKENKENKWLSGVRDDISVPSSSSLTGSRTSLASIDLEQMQRHAVSHESLTSSEFIGENLKKDDTDFCRVLLPDQSTTVLQIRTTDTIRDLIERLTERRALNFISVDVYPMNGNKALDQNKVISCLSCKELRVEQRVIFRVDLPNKKTIGVKAKATKNAVDILRPILQKYGFKLENVVIHVTSEEQKLNLNCCVSALDNKHIVVKTFNEFAECGYDNGSLRHSLPNKFSKHSNSSLNEITNKVFEDLLKGKAQAQFDELGILDLDQKSELDDRASSLSDSRSSSSHQSGIFNMVRRSSFHMDYSKNRLSQKHKLNLIDLGNSKMNGNDSVMNLRAVPDKPPLPKPRTYKTTNTRLSDSEGITEMFEVWKRAQRSRLEDQRGTEINGELPDFLKPKSGVDENTKLHESSSLKKGDSLCSKNRLSFNGPALNDVIGIIPTHQQADRYFSTHSMDFNHMYSPAPKDGTDLDRTLECAKDLDLDSVNDLDVTLKGSSPVVGYLPLRLSSPPPLPPKPKIRGPPPRPPSRPQGDMDDEDISSVQQTKMDLIKQSCRSRKPVYVDRENTDRLNISFV